MQKNTLQLYGILGISCVAFSLFFVDIFPTFAAEKKIGGWGWNPAMGWVRQRNTIPNKPDIGVTRNDAGALYGWSWSQSFGWICWGATCTNQDPGHSFPGFNAQVNGMYKYGRPIPPVVGSTSTASVAAAPVPVGGSLYPTQGWIKVISLGDRGWISLSRATAPGAKDYGVSYDKQKNEFSGWSWNVPMRAGGTTTVGWTVFSGKTLYTTTSTPPGGGNERRACEPHCDVVVQDVADVQNPTSKWKTQEIGAWVKTKGGNLYAKAGFLGDSEPPTGVPSDEYRNADFLMLSGLTALNQPAGIINFISDCEAIPANPLKSSCKKVGLKQGNVTGVKQGAINIAPPARVTVTIVRTGQTPRDRHVVRNAYGEIDLDALTTVNNGGINAYGRKVVKLDVNPETKLFNELSSTLTGGTVYYRDGDLTVGDAKTGTWSIFNGGSGKVGSRTVVVKGDLTIKSSILYDKSAVNASALKQLASVAWIVLKKDGANAGGGNVIIDKCLRPSDMPRAIAEISGIFFAEGEIHTGSGSFSECSGSIAGLTNDIRLKVVGSMIAKGLLLERKYGGEERGIDNGSENIINDGRSVVSIPPGLEDVLKKLPSR